MNRLEKAGIAVDVPAGWEASISGGGLPMLSHGARQPTILHLASFPLPWQRGSFGAGATDQMGPGDVFITLFEYTEESANTPLFAAQGLPSELLSGDFDRNMLQHGVQGQSGLQRFFTEKGRAFCLYVVLGSHLDRADLVKQVNSVIATMEIGP